MITSAVDNISIILSFHFNKDYISQNLCENRGTPKMKCNGKCQLSKAFKKKQKKERESSSHQLHKYVYTIPSNDLTSIDAAYLVIILKKSIFLTLNTFKQNCFLSIFHPPD
jgi:hypothetical protein